MKSEILQSYCVNTDATPAPCRLPKEKNRIVKGNMYVTIGGGERFYDVFDFHVNQSAKPIYEFLKGYSGVVQCDAHGNYDALFAPKIPDPNHPPPAECGCNAHCRRGFDDAQKTEPQRAQRFMDIYRELYRIESQPHDDSPDDRLARRQSDSVPILDSFFALCRVLERPDDPSEKSARTSVRVCACERNRPAILLRRRPTEHR